MVIYCFFHHSSMCPTFFPRCLQIFYENYQQHVSVSIHNTPFLYHIIITKTDILIFYYDLRLIYWHVLVNSFLIYLFYSKYLKKFWYLFLSLKVNWRRELFSCSFISNKFCTFFCFLLFRIALWNTELFKNLYWFFFETIFCFSLYLVFKLIYDSNHFLCLNVMTLYFFKNQSIFQSLL